MNEIMLAKQLLQDKVKEMDKLMIKAEKSLNNSPEGSLILSNSNGAIQYYHKTEENQKKGKYITAKNRSMAMALAQKDYDQQFLKQVEKQREKICRAITQLPETGMTEIYTALSKGRQMLVTPHVLTDEQYVEKWLNEQYIGKEFSPDAPAIITERGERVRSKSEKIIADKLLAMGIPYRYEFPLKLKGFGVIYPDFTLLNISKRKEFYLEHFGMMDNPEYSQIAILKLETYAKHGIYPGKNLLITFETMQRPLNMKVIESMLKEFI